MPAPPRGSAAGFRPRPAPPCARDAHAPSRDCRSAASSTTGAWPRATCRGRPCRSHRRRTADATRVRRVEQIDRVARDRRQCLRHGVHRAADLTAAARDRRGDVGCRGVQVDDVDVGGGGRVTRAARIAMRPTASRSEIASKRSRVRATPMATGNRSRSHALRSSGVCSRSACRAPRDRPVVAKSRANEPESNHQRVPSAEMNHCPTGIDTVETGTEPS